MFNQFRVRYPKGSLITELVAIKHGKYVVRALVQAEGVTLATGLAAADTVEMAEDQARSRALAFLDIEPYSPTEKETRDSAESLPVPPSSPPNPKPAFSQASLQATQSFVAPEKHSHDPIPASFSEAKPDNADKVDKALPLSSAVEEEKELGAAPTKWDPNNLPFTDDFYPSETDMLAGGDASELETPTDMQPLSRRNSQPTESPNGNSATPESQLNPALATSASEYIPPVQSQSTDTDTLASSEPDRLAELVSKTNVQIKRLQWTSAQGREYLSKTYDKRSRTLLTTQELEEFLHYLESLPTPID